MLTTDLHGGTAYCDIQPTTSGQTHEVFRNYFNHFEAGQEISLAIVQRSKNNHNQQHKDTIRYRITAHKIYREQDSINIAIHQITCYLEGKKVDKEILMPAFHLPTPTISRDFYLQEKRHSTLYQPINGI